MTVKRDFKVYAKKQLGLLLGKFNYFNTDVYFPKNSLIFRIACDEGIYDKDVFYFIFAFLKEDGLFIDIGTNIGLLSVPVLNNFKHTQVISFEPSATVLPHLMRTHTASKHKDRWTIHSKAVGDTIGQTNFKKNDAIDSAFDGVAPAVIHQDKNLESIEITTLDHFLNIPAGRYTSVLIKVDVEGFEFNVLKGAKNFIITHKPAIVIEIVKEFLIRYDISVQQFIDLINELDYNLYGLTTQAHITNVNELTLALLGNLNFVLLPKEAQG
jgi:FkbM family methyltransferase